MRRIALVLGLALLLAACGADDGAGPRGDATTTAPAASSDGSAPPPSSVGTADETPPASAAAAVLAGIGVEIVSLVPPEPGPHPVLSWPAIDGAARYTVVVQTLDGVAYWGWSGKTTDVRVGGGNSADLNQTAGVLEPMLWSLLAHDAGGGLVGFGPAIQLDP